MKSRKLSFVAAIVMVAMCLAGWTAYAQKSRPNRTEWEYKAVGLSTNPTEDKRLNDLGAQGWELVGVSDAGGGANYYFFKRQK